MKAILCALAVAFVACSQEEDDGLNFVPVESRYEIVGDHVECNGTVDERLEPEPGPATRHTCIWERVTVGGAEACFAILVFERENESSPWGLVATFTSSATRCT